MEDLCAQHMLGRREHSLADFLSAQPGSVPIAANWPAARIARCPWVLLHTCPHPGDGDLVPFPVNELPVFRPLSPVLSPPSTRHHQRMLTRRHNGDEGGLLNTAGKKVPSPPSRVAPLDSPVRHHLIATRDGGEGARQRHSPLRRRYCRARSGPGRSPSPSALRERCGGEGTFFARPLLSAQTGRLMHQRRGLQRLVRLLFGHLGGRRSSQFVIDQRQETRRWASNEVESRVVTGRPSGRPMRPPVGRYPGRTIPVRGTYSVPIQRVDGQGTEATIGELWQAG